MQLHQLEYVLAVSKHQSFTRAAEEIKISQSSISQQISNLEEELGVSLFTRTTRSVQLTPAGSEFIKHAARIMSEITAAHQCVHEYVSVNKGHLKVGIIPVVGHYFIPHLLATFQKKYPNIQLSLIENQCDELLELLHSSEIDVAIAQQISSDYEFQYFPLVTDQMVVLTSAEHPLASQKSVHLKQLKNENFITTPITSGHYHDFFNACRDMGFNPKIPMGCSSVKTILGLVSEGLGITVLSSKVAATFNNNPGIATLVLTPPILRRIFLIINKNTNISPALKALVNFTSQWIESKIS